MAAEPPNCQDKAMEKQKAERLAAALRENLRKRKAQARKLADQTSPSFPRKREAMNEGGSEEP